MKNRYCRFSFISLNAGLLESAAWNELTLSQIQVFIYIWSCLQWGKIKKKWNINFIDTENDLILVENVKYFCDNVHQTLIGNKSTAKIIFENIN